MPDLRNGETMGYSSAELARWNPPKCVDAAPQTATNPAVDGLLGVYWRVDFSPSQSLRQIFRAAQICPAKCLAPSQNKTKHGIRGIPDDFVRIQKSIRVAKPSGIGRGFLRTLRDFKKFKRR
jgi:hypothetical protein